MALYTRRASALAGGTPVTVFEALETRPAQQLPSSSGKTSLAAAIRYALSRLPRLKPCLSDCAIEIDNTAAERAERGWGLGRKN